MISKALAVVCALLAVQLAAGCGTGGRPLRPYESVGRFSGDGISFGYPAGWQPHRYEVSSSFSTSIVYLSPQRLRPPCITRHGTSNTTITCDEPLDHLQPGSILASWSTHAWLNWSFTQTPGTPLRVGGRAAKLDIQHDSCGIAADELMKVVIAIPGRAERNGWYELDACIRGPGTANSEREVRQLLRTVRFTP